MTGQDATPSTSASDKLKDLAPEVQEIVKSLVVEMVTNMKNQEEKENPAYKVFQEEEIDFTKPAYITSFNVHVSHRKQSNKLT